MQGVRLGQDELIREFGLSRRLAVRVGALLGKRVDVSATTIEMAASDSAVEKMLLDRRLLSAAEDLDTPTLAEIARETGAQDVGPFAVAEHEGWRTISLEEEQLAADGWEEARDSGALVATGDGGAMLQPEAAQSLFSPEEVARLKLDALTSGESSERVSALRKLRIAPLSAQEKGSIFLRVLLDPIAPARSEAIKGLEEMGFDRDTAEAIQDMLESDGHVRSMAVERVGVLLRRLEPAEQQIALRVLVEGLREVEAADARSHVLRVLGEAADLIARSPQVLEEAARLGMRKVVEVPTREQAWVRDFLFRLAEQNPPGMVDLLARGLETLRDPNLRAFTMVLIAQLELTADDRARLADQMIAQILEDGLEELERQKIGHNLISFGAAALEPLVTAFARGDARQRARLVPLLDMLLVDGPLDSESRNRVARLLLESLAVGERRLRLATYHTRIFSLPDLDRKLRVQAAEILVTHLRATDHPDVLDRVGDMIESLGEAAAPPLLEAVRNATEGPVADRLARVLGRVVSAILLEGGHAPKEKALLTLLRRRINKPGNTAGGYAIALGALAAAGAESQAASREDTDLLLGFFGQAPYVADLIEALGGLAASAHVDLGRKLRILKLLTQVVENSERPAEAAGMQEVRTADGILYEFNDEVAFESEAMPAVIEAMERIYMSPVTTDALRQQVVTELTRVWERVANWDVVWGPQSSQRLALALGRIGSRPHTPTAVCVSIAGSMRRQVNRMGVIQAMGELFQSPLDDEEFNALAVECANATLKHWDHPETAPEEWDIILDAVGLIAARPQFRPRARAVRDLRRRVVGKLFDHFSEGGIAALRPLERIRDCPTAPRKLRDEVRDRLRRALSLAPTS